MVQASRSGSLGQMLLPAQMIRGRHCKTTEEFYRLGDPQSPQGWLASTKLVNQGISETKGTLESKVLTLILHKIFFGESTAFHVSQDWIWIPRPWHMKRFNMAGYGDHQPGL